MKGQKAATRRRYVFFFFFFFSCERGVLRQLRPGHGACRRRTTQRFKIWVVQVLNWTNSRIVCHFAVASGLRDLGVEQISPKLLLIHFAIQTNSVPLKRSLGTERITNTLGMNPGFFPSARKWRRPLNLSLAFLMLSAATVSAAPFSSWAGKRSTSPQFPFQTARRPDLAQMMHDLRELYTSEYGDESSLHQDQEEEYLPMSKRAPFSSWAGKRAPFSSWAGKRAAFSSWAGKRAPFSSWAGKRSGDFVSRIGEDDDSEDGSNNGRFKRSSEEEMSSGFEGGEPQERTRRGANSFSAWGGKRAQLQRFTRDVHNDAMVPVRVMRPHRAAFSAWGG